jgi:ABC transport system ATP-binding/permease protein
MSLFSLLDVSLSFGGPFLLEKANFQVDPGERVCLLGRNGSGKSTLMRLITGELQPDDGQIFRQPGAEFRRLSQEVPPGLEGEVRAIVASGARELHDHEEEWERDVRVDGLLERMNLEPDVAFATLSGGLKRRVLLARALAGSPDLLLLDEPTNHLDLDSILWLEEFLLAEKVTLFFVTHDRAFLRRLATRIVDLDRGRLASWACDYDTYLVRKEEVQEAEERQQALFDKKLAQEEVWIRKGVKAQRSRAQGRIHALQAMRAERAARRERQGAVTLRLAEAERSGVKVIEAENASFAFPGAEPILRDFSLLLTRGDKIGLIGPNGAGKTTLLKLLLGQLAPTAGEVRHGTRLEVVYFDQFREQIDDDRSVADNIANGNATVTIDGRSRHVISYLQDFLFEPERARTPARVLSGGERNRLLLARLFTRPANVLVMDEPTNDLDAETLDLLEDLLVAYQGTLLIVSHDRDFLENVVTSCLVFEGEGRVTEYVGGYADWRETRDRKRRAEEAAAERAASRAPREQAAAGPRPRRLTAREEKELAELPGRIETIETEQQAVASRLADPALYQGPAEGVATMRARAAELERAHAAAFARWEELEARRGAEG